MLSIIIVTHNSEKDIGSFLRSFSLYKPAHQFEIIIVDNNSDDNTVGIIQMFNSLNVKLFARSERNGFGNNCNYGLKYAIGDVIAFLNPDIVFIENSLDQLESFFRDSAYGILGPKLLNSDLSIQFSARKFMSLKILFSRIRTKGADKTQNKYLEEYFYSGLDIHKPMIVDWVTGAAMFVKLDVFKKLNGGFDEAYKMYIEDEDFCYMAKKNGWQTVYYPYSKMIHHHQRNSIRYFSRKSLFHAKGLFIFLGKRYLGITKRIK